MAEKKKNNVLDRISNRVFKIISKNVLFFKNYFKKIIKNKITGNANQCPRDTD